MLRITIPSTGQSGITFSSFENQDLPTPVNGIDDEGDNNLVLIFKDEQDAVNYAEALMDVSSGIDDNNSPAKLAINDIIVAVQSDEFVRTTYNNN